MVDVGIIFCRLIFPLTHAIYTDLIAFISTIIFLTHFTVGLSMLPPRWRKWPNNCSGMSWLKWFVRTNGAPALSNIFMHYSDVIMGVMASQLTSLPIVYLTVYSGRDQRKHQSSASLAFVRGIHLRPVNSPYKWPVTRKMFPFDDIIMASHHWPNGDVQFREC